MVTHLSAHPGLFSVDALKAAIEPFDTIDGADFSALTQRIGDARVVLIGEATHGTSEFYRMRARITRELVENKGFTVVAAEADWPDAERIDEYVQSRASKPPRAWKAFDRFPSWMWRNRETLEFTRWLQRRNENEDEQRKTGFYGLDLYSLGTSIQEVIAFLERREPELADLARHRYRTLLSFQRDPVDYGRAALRERLLSCEDEVVHMLVDLLERRLDETLDEQGAHGFFDAERNAAVVAAAERYYRLLFQGSFSSWNHRDRHMMDTLNALLDYRGPDAKAVVWAHNSHVGDASATDMGRRGETNIGELARESHPNKTYAIGFGTHSGTVAAADDWGGEMRTMDVRPSREGSWEFLFHRHGTPQFMLPLSSSVHGELFSQPLLQRAIGVIYRPDTELISHYFESRLSYQFDEYIWFDETRSIDALSDDERAPDIPRPHPLLQAD